MTIAIIGRSIVRLRAFCIATVILSLILVVGCEWSESRADVGKAASQSREQALARLASSGGDVVPSPFVEVAAMVMPAVVSIDTKRTVNGSSVFNEPFGRLFRDLIPDMPRQEYEVPGYASGFIFDERGYVLTNNHVVEDAEEVIVRLADDVEFPAEIVGTDANTDIAVLKIESDADLPIVKLGDSDQIRIGDWAIAVGNPFGYLEGTMTVGVVSAKGRSDLNIVGGTPALQSFIQTDASINFGNSGGPLVSINGEAIGMNTAINPLGQGIGFAIPINLVRRVTDEIIRSGKVSWGYLGILPQAITKDLAEALDVRAKEGILVAEVVEDGPADKAGIKRGDIIVKFNGEDAREVDEFRMNVAQAGVGAEVKVEVLRDGDMKTLEVKLGERPTPEARAERPRTEGEWLGITVDDVGGSQGRRVAPEGLDQGVVIVRVDENSPAADAGMRVGDIVEEVDGKEVKSLEDYEKAIEEVKDHGDKPVLFLLRREGLSRYVAVKAGQE
jgi:serine protease Do